MNPAGNFCNQCGNALSPNARFCPKCGASVSPQRPAPDPGGAPPVAGGGPAPAQFAPASFTPAPAAPQRRGLGWIIALVAILAVVGLACCLAVGLLWAYPRWFTSATQTPTTPATAEAALPATATAQPTAEAAPSPTPSPTPIPLPYVDYNGVSFSYDPSLASQVLPETVPAVNDADAPEWDLAPEHLSFKFVGYPLFPDAFHEPRILVFPAEEYATLSPQAGQEIADLRTLLAQKPAALAPDQTLPFLPIWNAGQVMQANITYLDFQNGNGVRFLTHYAQDVYPVSSRSLFYTFQGLTSNGRFYISAVMPVSNAILPDENSVVVDQAFADNFSNYIASIEQELSAAPPSSFIPGLTLLDDMIASLQVK